MDNKKIGNELRKLREAKNLTQLEVAKNIGISVSAINNYEVGIRIPRDEIKLKLANFYGKTVYEIFFN